MPPVVRRRSLTPTRSRRPHHPIVAVIVATLVAFLAGAVGATAVGAETPSEVAEAVAIDGVYVAPQRGEIDEVAVAEAIREARARGLRLIVAVPNDPQPDPAAFARRILEESDVDAALVFPAEGPVQSHVIDEFEAANLRALEAARSSADPAAAAASFTDELLTEPVRSVPPIVGQLVRWVLLMALVLAGAVGIERLLRRAFPRRRSPRMNGT